MSNLEEEFILPLANVHTFYYPWYGNPERDGAWYHWNHRYLPHWNANQRRKWPKGRHKPPLDIGSNFYPQLGVYSSLDKTTLDKHMEWMKFAGIGVVVVSYYPVGLADDEGKPWEGVYPLLLDSAAKYGLKVTFHIEPYTGRSAHSIVKDFRSIRQLYGSHDAFYWHTHNGKALPLYYVYDSYLINSQDWKVILLSKETAGNQRDVYANDTRRSTSDIASIRGTDADAHVLGLITTEDSARNVMLEGFDGFYTYFGAKGFTFGSNWDNWKYLRDVAAVHGALFCPSVAPGYIDERVRPWNKVNIHSRKGGDYYRESWTAAIATAPHLISITSFNEWHEGSQIEPAVPYTAYKGGYLNYYPQAPEYYLQLTREFVRLFNKTSTGSG